MVFFLIYIDFLYTANFAAIPKRMPTAKIEIGSRMDLRILIGENMILFVSKQRTRT